MDVMAEAVPVRSGRVAAGLVYTLRIMVTAHAVAIIVAASFAGQALVYDDTFTIVTDGARAETHVMIGLVAHLIGLLQLVAALLLWRPGRGAGWPVLASLGLLLLGIAQHFLLAIGLGAHVPNGVALFGLTVIMLVWVWSPRAAMRR